MKKTTLKRIARTLLRLDMALTEEERKEPLGKAVTGARRIACQLRTEMELAEARRKDGDRIAWRMYYPDGSEYTRTDRRILKTWPLIELKVERIAVLPPWGDELREAWGKVSA